MLPRDRVEALLDPGDALPGDRPARRARDVRRRDPGRRPHRGGRPRHGAVNAWWLANDATVKGGTYFPMTVKKHLRAQEIAAGKQAALPLPRRLRRRQPAQPGRGLPRPRPLRPHLLQPGPHVGRRHPAGGRRDGLLHGRRRLRARNGGRKRHRAPAGHHLPRRAAAGEERPPARSSSAEDLGGGDLHARTSGVVDHLAETRRPRARDRAPHRRHLQPRRSAWRSTSRPPRDPLLDPATARRRRAA